MRLDSRHILAGEGVISLARSALAEGGSLCDFCSIHDECEVRPGDENPSKVQTCTGFVPAFTFVPPLIGLEGRFSTFRASSIWYDRARIIYRTHKRVALYNAETKERIGFAKLVGAFHGKFKHLMAEHAWSNHLCIGKSIPIDDAPTWLPRQIRNLAGSRYVKSPEQVCTVIYLERVDG